MFKKHDYVVGIAAILLGIGIIIQAQFLEVRTSLDPAGPKALPIMIAVGMIVIGIIHVIGGRYVSRRLEQNGTEESRDLADKVREYKPVISIVIISLIYGLSLNILGYLVMTPLLIGAILWALEVRSMKKILQVSLIMTVILYVVFKVGLQVDLPLGLFEYLFS